MTPRLHLRLHAQCEICLGSLEENESVVAIYVEEGTHPYHLTCPFDFPKLSNKGIVTTKECSICHEKGCDTCRDTPEAVPLHAGCYNVFVQKCPITDTDVLLRRLWNVAVSRKPWKNSMPLFLPKQLDMSMVKPVADWLGMPRLSRMSPELVDLIRSFSEHDTLWRCISAFSLAAYMAETEEGPQVAQVVRLRDIASWTRGGELETALSSQTLPPVIRITIDCDGIYSVERLAETPEYSGECSASLAYSVDPAEDYMFREADVQLLDGRLRLVLAPGELSPVLWNTPAPPFIASFSLSDLRFTTRRPRPFPAEEGRMNGIPIFYSQKNLCNMHVESIGNSLSEVEPEEESELDAES